MIGKAKEGTTVGDGTADVIRRVSVRVLAKPRMRMERTDTHAITITAKASKDNA